MLLEDNLQLFSYLGFRNFTFLHSTEIYGKINGAVSVVLFFLVVVYACCFYFLTPYLYKGLSKYFLDNINPNKRGAYFCMTLIYGMRPVLRGAIHAFYEENALQLALLGGLDIVVFLVLSYLQIRKRVFENRLVACLYCIYLLSSAYLNCILLFNRSEGLTKRELKIEEECLLAGIIIRGACPVLAFFRNFVDSIQTYRRISKAE